MDHTLRWTLGVVVASATLLSACGQHADPTAKVATDQTSQPTTPPPPGDSTPVAADSHTAAVSQGTENASRAPGSQSTVGSAASGAPPYTLNGAPEGNKSPTEPVKK